MVEQGSSTLGEQRALRLSDERGQPAWSSSRGIPWIRNHLSRDVSPESSPTCDDRHCSASASTSWIAALALPFSGAAETATRSAPARSPRMAFRLAPGWRRHRQDGPVGVGGQGDHPATPSNKAEPTRTRVAPSSIAVSKSFDIPIESCSRGRPLRSGARSIAERPQQGKRGRAVSGVVSSAAIVISPTIGMCRQAAIASASEDLPGTSRAWPARPRC